MKIKLAIIFIALKCLLTLAHGQNAPELAQKELAPTAAAQQAGRERIGSERAAVDAAFKKQEAACYQVFAVNDCLAQATARKRETLADLRRQEISLNDAERKRKGANQVQKTETKSSAESQQEAADKRADALQKQQQRVDQSVDKQQRSAERRALEASKRAEQAQRAKSVAEKDAARRKRASEAGLNKKSMDVKQQQAQEHRAGLVKRLAEKEKPPAAPLPVPP